jgi:hypothetical protein
MKRKTMAMRLAWHRPGRIPKETGNFIEHIDLTLAV